MLEKEEKRFVKKTVFYTVLTLIVLAVIFRGCGFFDKVVDPDRAVSNYENFYTLYEGCEQICNDMSIAQSADSISGGFSKQERIIGLENKLNNLIKQYNAASDAWTKSMWKADDLPHKIKRSDFICN